MKKKVFVVMGPTASGKSGLALRLAEQIKGSVVNADSMQIYKDLTIISARPTESEMNGIPHLLYGYVDAWTQGTVHEWLSRVVPVLNETEHPVLVGGTGLYLSSLIKGINQIPDIPEEIRKKVRETDINEIKMNVKDCPFTDPQRLQRAYEVQLATGKSLSYFLKLPPKKLTDFDFYTIFINPDRNTLYQNCETRFYQMIEQGGIEEVKNLLSLKPTGGVIKAIGVNEISLYLQNMISKEEMCKQAILATRHYAKRQITWFRHQLSSDIVITHPANVKSLL